MKKPSGPAVSTALLLVFMSACIVAVWLRNRDVLRDVFDYSMVITAAGKIEAGLKPYSDVRSPIQSLVYLLNYGAEQMFGRSYLGLTWGGLVQALGGALVIVALVRGALGMLAATLVALAVAMAGLVQHAVFFYNPVGILCLGVVVLGMAQEPEFRPLRSWKAAAVGAALFLGGINKLNFHGAAMACAGLLAVAAWADGKINLVGFAKNVAIMVLCGLVLPLVFELAWTGATFGQWLDNVVLLPSERRGYLHLALSSQIYLRPEHDFYHHIPIRAIGGVGLVVLAVTSGWLFQEAWAGRRGLLAWIARLLLVAAGVALGALLMVTNHETILLSSLAYPLIALALCLQFRRADRAPDRWMAHTLVASMVIWAGAGAYAAWHGSRVLFAPNPPAWSDYVPLKSASPALVYFAGVKMLPADIAATQQTATKLEAMEGPDGRLHDVLFGPGLEWFERAYPETILRHAPVGYAGGITLNEKDVGYMEELLGHGRRRLVTQNGWQTWPKSIWAMIERDYRREMPSPRDILYHPRGPTPPPVEAARAEDLRPWTFRDQIGSNVLITATHHSRGMAVHASPGGAIFGADRDTNWWWPHGSNAIEGWAVAQLAAGRERDGVVSFRVIDGDPETGIIWELPVRVSAQQREVAVPFSMQAGGRPVWLQTVIRGEDQGGLIGGWRGLRITHTNQSDLSPVPPYAAGLQQVQPAGGEPVGETITHARAAEALLPDGWVRLPAEIWRQSEMQPGRIRIEVEFTPDPEKPSEHVVLTLGWYRASRFEIMTEQVVDPQATPRATIEAHVTEPGGWIGVLTRCDGVNDHRLRIVSWQKLP